MALISGVLPAPPRARRPLDMGLPAATGAGPQIPNPVQPVQPVPAPTHAQSLTPQLYPPDAYAAARARTVIEVDGVPFINDEAVLGDDIVRPAGDQPDPGGLAEDTGESRQTALPPQVLIPAAPDDPNPATRAEAQATPWPESLRILRSPPSWDDRAG